MIRKIILLSTLILVVLISVYFTVSYFLNTVNVTIKTTNIESFSIIHDGSELYSGNQETTKRVPKNVNIYVNFKGVEGYETGQRLVKINEQDKVVDISPYYSFKKLSTLIPDNKAQIDHALREYSVDIIDKYNREYTLHHFGEWASVKLVWKGEYSPNSDTQFIILHKVGDTWSIVGGPSIVFFAGNYREIPVDILKEVNAH